MRLLKRNLQTIWVSYGDVTKEPIVDEHGYETGEYTLTYPEPVEMRVSVSVASGRIARELFGNLDDYSHVILSETKINKDARIWYNAPTTGRHNYVVKPEAPRLNVYAIGVMMVD